MKDLVLGKIKTFCAATRAYSLPISLMSWLVPFIYAYLHDGNILFGLIALTGIIILHMATNLFDDIVDYSRELIDIKQGNKSDFNFQKGKCAYILDNELSLNQAILVNSILYLIVFVIAGFFLKILGLKLLYVIIPSALLCLSYPILGCLGLGEIIVVLIFSPLIYSGVYFAMTSHFSLEILMISVPTGLISVAILYNHSLLDYKYDTTNRKITLCRICGSEKNALFLLALIITAGFLSLLFWVLRGDLHFVYLLPFLTLPLAVKLIKEMNIYIKQDKVPDNSQIFLQKFMLAQNLQIYFIIILCISIIIANWS